MPTRSPLAAPRGVQVPRVRHAPQVRANAWEDVADLAKAYGLALDPWQENVLSAAMGERADGQWAASTVGVSVPRQNGKGALIEARELAGLLVFGEKTIIHSAHEQKTARVGFERVLSYFENYDDLRKKVRSVMSALGREHIKLNTGQELHFPARSKGAIRGFSIDCLILDEGQILGDPAWEAIKPTISARPNVQTWVLGTPPTPLDDGTVFTRMRQRGLEGKDHRLCWCEWSAAPGSSFDDPVAWAQANPALGLRISLDAVSDERNELSDSGFGRERLGMWEEATNGQVIDPQTWAKAGDMTGEIDSEIALAVDVMPDRTAGSVSVAGRRSDGRWQVELVDNRNSVGWIVDRVVAITSRQPVRAVIIDAQSPAASLIEALEARGVLVTKTGARDMAAACGQFYDAVMEDQLRHLDVPLLNAALGVARKRSLGDAWAWHRKNAVADITPLVSCTLALWGAQSESVARIKKPSAAFAF